MSTAPLSENFTTDGDRLIALAEKVFTFEESDDFTLEDWQKWLIRRILETYPPGHDKAGELRYRQVVVSLGRQNGKSVLGAVFALYGLMLMVQRSARVISLASDVEQANIIFKKVRFAIEAHPALDKRFKATKYRGVNSRDSKKPASYVVKAGNGKGLQGAAVNLCLFDEVHISREDAWDAMVFGMTSQKNAMVLGITTAGDDNSTLLKRLYITGKAAVSHAEGFDERFGFFLWEAPAHLDLYDPEALKAANPAIASGRIDVNQEIQTLKGLPEHAARRFRLNQFVSSENVWLQASKWLQCAGEGIPKDRNLSYQLIVERSLNWEYATITASAKDYTDGKVYTEVIKTYVNPDIDWIKRDIMYLFNNHNINKVFMDSAVLKDLHTLLKEEALPVEYLTANQMMNATATAYALINEKRVVHANDPVIMQQLGRTVTENAGDGYKASRRKSDGPVDAVIATIIAIWAAENSIENNSYVYVA